MTTDEKWFFGFVSLFITILIVLPVCMFISTYNSREPLFDQAPAIYQHTWPDVYYFPSPWPPVTTTTTQCN